MIEFQHEFLGYPMQSGYGLKVDSSLVRSQFGSGDTRQRRKRRSMPATVDLSFKFTTAQLDDFQYFCDVHGFDWFLCKISVPGADSSVIRWKEIRFIEGYSTSYPAHDTIMVSVKAEMRDISNTAEYIDAMNYCESKYVETYYTNTEG